MSVISGSLGAVMGSNAQTDAARSASDAQNYATTVQQQIYNQEVERNKPFYDVGTGAIPQYLKMLYGGYDMKESPAAQYELQQGSKTLNRQLAARGLLGSGNAAQRLAELSSGIAAKDYSDQYSRLVDALKLGTGASSSMGAASQTYSGAVGQGASNLGNLALQSGAARASLYSGLGGASGSALGTGLKLYDYGSKAGWWGGGSGATGAVSNSDIAGAYDNMEYLGMME